MSDIFSNLTSGSKSQTDIRRFFIKAFPQKIYKIYKKVL